MGKMSSINLLWIQRLLLDWLSRASELLTDDCAFASMKLTFFLFSALILVPRFLLFEVSLVFRRDRTAQCLRSATVRVRQGAV